MDPLAAQEKLAKSIKDESGNLEPCFWKLSGDDRNSFAALLGIQWSELKSILVLCGVMKSSGSINQNNLELLFRHRCLAEPTQCKHKVLKAEWFIKVGAGIDVSRPQDNYNANGEPTVPPTKGVHCHEDTSTRFVDVVSQLLSAAKESVQEDKKKKKEPIRRKSPREELFSLVAKLVADAAASGNKTIDRRWMSRLRKQCAESVHADTRKLMDQFLLDGPQKLALSAAEAKEETILTPDRVSSAAVVTPPTGTNLESEMSAEEKKLESQATLDFKEMMEQEITLQALLQKRILEKKERAFQLEHKNGRKLQAICPPDAKTSAALQTEARRSGWVESMLNAPERLKGMLLHLAKTQPQLFKKVAKQETVLTMTTAQTAALAQVGKLNDSRLKAVRSFLYHIGKLDCKCGAVELKKTDEEVGNDKDVAMAFGTHTHEWSETKGKEKKPSEQMEHWTSSLMDEVATEVDLFIASRLSEEKNINMVDCKAAGFDSDGVTALIGGDHGDKNCPMGAKVNLCSPKNRKQSGKLNDFCPVITFGSVKCTKDAHEVLQQTVMPSVAAEVSKMEAGAMLTVYNTQDVTKFQSCPVKKSIQLDEVCFKLRGDRNVMSHADGSNVQAEVVPSEKMSNVHHSLLGSKLVVTNFNVPHFGDLAFLAMPLGMNNSAGNHCLLCQLKASEFNCTHDKLVPRTREHLEQCLEQCLADHEKAVQKGNKNLPANRMGVNKKPLLNVDPSRIVIPILHCPMGLVDKALECFKKWAVDEVEKHDPATEAARTVYNNTKQRHQLAIQSHQTAVDLLKFNPTDGDLVRQEQCAKAEVRDAIRAVDTARNNFEELKQRNCARSTSLTQTFERTFSTFSIAKANCHGGKFNGANCIRVMENSKDTFLGIDNKNGFQQAIMVQKLDNVHDEIIKQKCREYASLFGTLDAIWSKVRGIDEGLLPAEAQCDGPDRAVASGEKQWIDMGLSTLQPKWHLTFDGHLSRQFRELAGLADKADDSIEFAHQEFKRLRDRFRGTESHKLREKGIKREMKRQKSTKIRHQIDRHEQLIKRKTPTKRQSEAEERKQSAKRAKKEKRDAFVAENPPEQTCGLLQCVSFLFVEEVGASNSAFDTMTHTVNIGVLNF